MLIKTGDIVTCSLDDHLNSWLVSGRQKDKLRLVKSGLPDVVFIVSKTMVKRVGPWR